MSCADPLLTPTLCFTRGNARQTTGAGRNLPVASVSVVRTAVLIGDCPGDPQVTGAPSLNGDAIAQDAASPGDGPLPFRHAGMYSPIPIRASYPDRFAMQFRRSGLVTRPAFLFPHPA
jgi:hypothetical protein